ncbi:hypothetical protein [Vibrio sp. LaRot3]|uniref:hypothetical protein n=1 Tax=Vibrio sp. LaRot3 TaxID=2998829 RepID=UPI0022CE0C11|nr:hypothetical protein [Vibrio sp. LaRot3]MDA0147341.1 hypothetical protein [Vibrio sp. LaRot3]
MNTVKTLLSAALISASLVSTPLLANPTPEILSNYNLAAEGDEAMVDTVYGQLNQLIDQQGAKPLTLVYLGSTQTMQGRDAFLPWNKMKFTEQGLATIAKGIGLIDTLPESIDQQQRIQGIPEAYLAQALAATTYTSLPDMFNHFERGYDMFLTLLAQPQFEQQPFAATSWIYRYAIEAALRAEDLPQAKQWLTTMEKLDVKDKQTQAMQQLMSNQS